MDIAALIESALGATKSVADAISANAPAKLVRLKAKAQLISERANNKLLHIKLKRVTQLRKYLEKNHGVTIGDLSTLPGASPDVVKIVQDELLTKTI